jgi:hypothetical protein
MTPIAAEPHNALFVRLKLTDAERANPQLRRAAERRAAANGYFASADHAAAFFDAQEIANDPHVSAELRGIFVENERFQKRADAQADKTRAAFARHEKAEQLRAGVTRIERRISEVADWQSKLDAYVSSAPDEFYGVTDLPAAAALGSSVVGAKYAAALIADSVLPKLREDLAAAQHELKTFAAAPSPSN